TARARRAGLRPAADAQGAAERQKGDGQLGRDTFHKIRHLDSNDGQRIRLTQGGMPSRGVAAGRHVSRARTCLPGYAVKACYPRVKACRSNPVQVVFLKSY